MIKRVKLSAASLVALLAIISLDASAVPTTLTDTIKFEADGAYDINTNSNDLDDWGTGAVNFLQNGGDFVSWTHSYEFSPAYDHILDGSLALSIVDDVDSGWFNLEFAFGYAEDGTWGFGEVDTATYDFNVNTAFLEDGLFSVTLYSVLGDFYIDTSELRIEYEPVSSVPEPSTVAILGLGLMLLGAVQFIRRKA
jgi:hypothetical protein